MQDKVIELHERHMGAATREERQRKDAISHFVLRLAYCRTGAPASQPLLAGQDSSAQCGSSTRPRLLAAVWWPTPALTSCCSATLRRRGPAPLADCAGVRPVPRALQGHAAQRAGRCPGGQAVLFDATAAVSACA